MNTKLQTQFKKLLSNPLIISYLTKDLYTELHTRGSMIAHFNRNGFHKARFWTLKDFDHTIECIRASKKLKYLLNNITCDELAQARYRVASNEAHVIVSMTHVQLAQVEKLQAQFSWKLV